MFANGDAMLQELDVLLRKGAKADNLEDADAVRLNVLSRCLGFGNDPAAIEAALNQRLTDLEKK